MDVVAAYTQQLKALLPPGELWKLTGDAVTSATLGALAEELARVHGRGDTLVDESDPRTAEETLGQWEAMLGLPDDAVVEIPNTTEERRLAITQKYLAQGGQTRAYFIALAAACGYTVTINDAFGVTITRAGTAVAGDFLTGLWAAFLWEVVVQPPTGDALSHEELEAIINRVKPAHTSVIFTYL